jgi:gas vesicle protein
MEDIEKAYKIAEKTAGDLGMFKTDLAKADALLKDYGEKRDNLLNGMVSLLEKSGEDGLDGEWKESCNNGKEALSALSDAMPPEGGGGLPGIGLGGFYRGELKTWDENGKAAIALAAQEMATIHLIHSALIEECKTALGAIKDDDAEIQEAVKDIFPDATSFLKDIAAAVSQIVSKMRSPGQSGGAQDLTDRFSAFFTNMFKQISEGSQKKGALKRKLTEQIKRVEQTRDQIGEEKINETFEEATKAIDSLQGVKDESYEALDWKEFGDGCKEALAKKHDECADRASELFEGGYEDLTKQAELSGKSLCDDSDKQATWMDEIEQLFENIGEAIEAQEAIAESLAEGPVQQVIREALKEIKETVRASADQFKQVKEESEKEINAE